MKFPRSTRVFRGQLDAAPFASVFFLLVMFVLLGSLMYTPGVHIQLPVADELPGTDRPTISVAIGAANQLYFENQMISESDLKRRLKSAVQKSPEPLTLVIQADKFVTYENLMRLLMLAWHAGIRDAQLPTRPRP
jgi:biopolymer transport protein ExbD